MKKVFGFLLIGLGIVTLISGLSGGTFIGGYEILGGIIGISLICFLPAYFLLRDKKKFVDANKDSKQ